MIPHDVFKKNFYIFILFKKPRKLRNKSIVNQNFENLWFINDYIIYYNVSDHWNHSIGRYLF